MHVPFTVLQLESPKVQWLMAVQVVPEPEYPVLQAQEKVPAPVEVQVDPVVAQLLVPPYVPVVQLLMAVQVTPLPVYWPLIQAQLNVPGPVLVQVEVPLAQLLPPFVQGLTQV